MKAKEFKLGKDNSENRATVYNAITRAIKELPLDQDYSVKISNYDSSKTAKQRRLQWKWYTELSRSGIGSSENPEKIDLDSKWRFARPLLLAGDDPYSIWITDVWNLIVSKYPNDYERQKQFFVYAVHTESMTKEMMSDYLRSFQYYWTSKSVQLCDPSLAGLDLTREIA